MSAGALMERLGPWQRVTLRAVGDAEARRADAEAREWMAMEALRHGERLTDGDDSLRRADEAVAAADPADLALAVAETRGERRAMRRALDSLSERGLIERVAGVTRVSDAGVRVLAGRAL